VRFYLPRWQDGDHWTRIDPLQVDWVHRTETRSLLWAGLLISGAVLTTTYAGLSALVRSWTAWPTALWDLLVIVGVVVTGLLALTGMFAQPTLVGVTDRGVLFGRYAGEAVEWDQLIRTRRTTWGIAVDFAPNYDWWVWPAWSVGRMIWSSQTASRYIDRAQLRAILQRPQCPGQLRC
jgi:hypothetical protein